MIVTAVASMKGGTGKTTTTMNLGAALAASGHPALLVDLDPQGSLSYGLDVRPQHGTATVADVLAGRQSLHEAISLTGVEQLYVLPADERLGDEAGRRRWKPGALREALRSIGRKNSHVLIDCPPHLGPLTIEALLAAGHVLIPTPPQHLAVASLELFFDRLEAESRVRRALARPLGIVLTMANPFLVLTERVRKELKERYGALVFRSIVRQTVRLAEAPGLGKTIFQHAPASSGAESHRALAREYLRRVRGG